MRTCDEMVVRELSKRYPNYEGALQQHPAYLEVRAEILDYLDDVWNYEAWETAEGERFPFAAPFPARD